MRADYKEIGRLIRKYRKARGMTQGELAEAIDISPTHMSHIETAGTKLSLPVLLDVADSLDVSLTSLISEQPIQGKEALIEEASGILTSCSDEEAMIMLDVIKTMQVSFRKHSSSGQ